MAEQNIPIERGDSERESEIRQRHTNHRVPRKSDEPRSKPGREPSKLPGSEPGD